MKKLFIAIAGIAFLTSCTQTKIGYADTEKIMDEYDAVKDIKEEIEEKNKTLQAKYEKLDADFQAQVAAYQKRGRRNTKKEQDFQDTYQQLSQGYQLEAAALEKESQERLEALVEDIKDFTEDYASGKGYTFVLGTEEQSFNILYGDDTHDLTLSLIEALNKDYKEGNKVEKAPVEDSKEEASAETEEVKDSTATE
jgi:outer membrane protein